MSGPGHGEEAIRSAIDSISLFDRDASDNLIRAAHRALRTGGILVAALPAPGPRTDPLALIPDIGFVPLRWEHVAKHSRKPRWLLTLRKER